MKKITLIIVSILLTGQLLISCSEQALKSIMKTATENVLSSTDVANGLKQALEQGANFAGKDASKLDGFNNNPLIRIPFPPEVQKVEQTLRSLGLGSQVDNFVLGLNRSAEDAAKQAAPIFISAIKQMTFQDAWAILKGDKNAATQFLIRTTTTQLKSAFLPVITSSLNKPLIPGLNISALKGWNDITTRYNKIPLVKPVNTDLAGYANTKAIEGLFKLVEKEELKIRQDPAARLTDLMKRVFAQQG